MYFPTSHFIAKINNTDRVVITQFMLFRFCVYYSSVLFENKVLIVVREENIIFSNLDLYYYWSQILIFFLM